MNSFLHVRVMIVMLFFTKILLVVQRDVKVRKHLRDISFNKYFSLVDIKDHKNFGSGCCVNTFPL